MILSSIPVGLPWFQRFIFIISIAKGRGKINLWNYRVQLGLSWLIKSLLDI
jgi:hypothetical protein